jgi:hypothetical protein
MVRVYNGTEREFIFHLARNNIIGFYPYFTTKFKPHGSKRQKAFEDPAVYGFAFVKKCPAYDADLVRNTKCFVHFRTNKTNCPIKVLTKGKTIWEPDKKIITVTSQQILKMAVASALYVPDLQQLAFKPTHGMLVKITADFAALNQTLAMAAACATITVVRHNGKTKITDVLIGRMSASIHSQFLLPA